MSLSAVSHGKLVVHREPGEASAACGAWREGLDLAVELPSHPGLRPARSAVLPS